MKNKRGNKGKRETERYVVDKGIVDSSSTDPSAKQGKEANTHERKKKREHTGFQLNTFLDKQVGSLNTVPATEHLTWQE
jgi:hypothetical protein